MAERLRPLEEYRAFVFDFDGVLADSVEIKAEAFGELYKPFGNDVVNKVMTHHRANGGMPRRKKFKVWHETFLGTPLDETGLDELCRKFSALVVDRVVAAPEIPGARAFLEVWHGRLPLFVDSATPDGEIARIVQRRGLKDFFVSVYGSGHSKVDNLRTILAENHLKPGQVLFFGDASSDLDAARTCGTDFLGIVPGQDAPLLQKHPDTLWAADFLHFLAGGKPQ